MTEQERCRYVRAVRTVSTRQPYKSCYDQLIGSHRTFFNTGIHGTRHRFFLPWHRLYILSLENLLRQIDCRITVPYWDWSLSHTAWKEASIWNSKCGFGGDGSATSSCVTTGPFAWPFWRVTPSTGSGCLRRNFNGEVPDCVTAAFIQQIDLDSFDSWRVAIEVNLHNTIHCRIGQHMCTQDSSNDPIFFLHHGFIDKLWSDWQNKGSDYKFDPVYAQNFSAMPGAYGYRPVDVFDLQNQPGCISVCLEQPILPCKIPTTYAPICPASITSVAKLANLIPRPVTGVPESAFRLFRNTARERSAAMKLCDTLSDPGRLEAVLRRSDILEGMPSNHTEMGVMLNRVLFEDNE